MRRTIAAIGTAVVLSAGLVACEDADAGAEGVTQEEVTQLENRIENLEKTTDERFKNLDERFTSLEERVREVHPE